MSTTVAVFVEPVARAVDGRSCGDRGLGFPLVLTGLVRDFGGKGDDGRLTCAWCSRKIRDLAMRCGVSVSKGWSGEVEWLQGLVAGGWRLWGLAYRA